MDRKRWKSLLEGIGKVVVDGVVVRCSLFAVRSLNTFLELMPTSQLRLPYIVLVHQSITPVHYTGPLHRSITPVHYTGPLHRSITPVHYTSPLHQSITIGPLIGHGFYIGQNWLCWLT